METAPTPPFTPSKFTSSCPPTPDSTQKSPNSSCERIDSSSPTPKSNELRMLYSQSKRKGRNHIALELKAGDIINLKKEYAYGTWLCEWNGVPVRMCVSFADDVYEKEEPCSPQSIARSQRHRGSNTSSTPTAFQKSKQKRRFKRQSRFLPEPVKQSLSNELTDMRLVMEEIKLDLDLIIKAFYQDFCTPDEIAKLPPQLILEHTPDEKAFEKLLASPYVPVPQLTFLQPSDPGTPQSPRKDYHQNPEPVQGQEIALVCPQVFYYHDILIPTFNLNSVSKEDITSLETLEWNVFPYVDKDNIEFSLLLVMHMFHQLGLVSKFNIDEITLFRFLKRISTRYRGVPFHNWFHAFNVTQTAYFFLTTCDAKRLLSPLEQFAIMVATICHDADHPGFNNAFQVKAHTKLATIHKKSTLENHHLLHACFALSQPECNILKNLTPVQKDLFMRYLKDLILSTDLAIHGIVLRNITERKKQLAKQYNKAVPQLDQEDVTIYICCLIKCADLSNEIRPKAISARWANMVMQEFLKQSAKEVDLDLPLTPFMNPKHIIIAKEQINFITNLCLPLYEQVVTVVPNMAQCIKRMQSNLAEWRHRVKSFYSETEVSQASDKSIWERPQAKDKRLKLSETLDKQAKSTAKVA